MKTIGLIGGTSWESTQIYYGHLNRLVQDRLGGHSSARLLLHSVNFAEFEPLMRAGKWDVLAERLCSCARQVEAGGGECLLLCTNTMHRVAECIEEAVDIPLLHIVDALGCALQEDCIDTVGLLGTTFTAMDPSYSGRLKDRFGVRTLKPSEALQQRINAVIFEELCHGVVSDESRCEYQAAIDELHRAGCGGIILGCTEIGMLISPEDSPLPLYDTAHLHACAAVDWALVQD
ncbi:MAG: aspartate/glutamate racemase family protein [Gammaproteobacteria bacterium AqS3]|nr:aspartate/glutamate racemase family protein [Gammaproteobacteria bacterium AqS3]